MNYQAWRVRFKHVPPGTELSWIVCVPNHDSSYLTPAVLGYIIRAIALKHNWPEQEVCVTSVEHLDRAFILES